MTKRDLIKLIGYGKYRELCTFIENPELYVSLEINRSDWHEPYKVDIDSIEEAKYLLDFYKEQYQHSQLGVEEQNDIENGVEYYTELNFVNFMDYCLENDIDGYDNIVTECWGICGNYFYCNEVHSDYINNLDKMNDLVRDLEENGLVYEFFTQLSDETIFKLKEVLESDLFVINNCRD